MFFFLFVGQVICGATTLVLLAVQISAQGFQSSVGVLMFCTQTTQVLIQTQLLLLPLIGQAFDETKIANRKMEKHICLLNENTCYNGCDTKMLLVQLILPCLALISGTMESSGHGFGKIIDSINIYNICIIHQYRR